ncbi:hypothetical protein LEP1GSC188_1702 [Leptospira weilii serovar Topaz str. LT2116]|uniref:Uncharacterized protein n=5 Tax=Leptospira weilii TaxID=28184 RepID=M3G8J0_9LEPT|nr:hypothetical protein LEP1GSC036_1678 [Leptospira weilii str. 2006001853]EMF82309.1 hypothetical protein LEP1GSC188_1702 [Leptospira weilii serovar Topaz str. LT2116]EMJ65867.1 hypothetical protein LEP1GSC051_3158 [Leptospira sp. P2653]EMM73825.1 hypothetical protein LEP1GSC038_2368 [Leptospira weilii str. 2006001855]EMN42653.1 hypothetical protein LEP1GSC086_1386 [Leptospira weilii str. LNT 1234]EMN91498.1 hypothetical protein LEP1GSC108_3484 [Leptospira weilii str. UI 13098]EMY14173.1 hyp
MRIRSLHKKFFLFSPTPRKIKQREKENVKRIRFRKAVL